MQIQIKLLCNTYDTYVNYSTYNLFFFISLPYIQYNTCSTDTRFSNNSNYDAYNAYITFNADPTYNTFLSKCLNNFLTTSYNFREVDRLFLNITNL